MNGKPVLARGRVHQRGAARDGGAWGPADPEDPVSGPWGDGPGLGSRQGDVTGDRRSRPRDRLRVSLLGHLDVRTAQGRVIPISGRHAPALFALLILVRRPRAREAIAAELWPDVGSSSVGSLRQALWVVRHALSAAGLDPATFLDIRPEAIGIRPDAPLTVDIDHFEGALDDPRSDLDTAIALYRGDLLESLGHECFAAERERLADRYEDALVEAAARRLAAGDPSGARLAAERALVRDPLREEAHATLIAIHGLVGSRSQVVRQYRRLRVVLARELGEPPLPETDAAYRVAISRTVNRSLEQAVLLDGEHLPKLVALGR
jgi:DNA-binding SARP family transcriptional activator